MPIFNHEHDNRIDWTIERIRDQWPEYDVYENGGSYSSPNPKFLALRKMFYEKLSDKQISMLRGLWHAWKIEGVLENEAKIKEFINQWI